MADERKAAGQRRRTAAVGAVALALSTLGSPAVAGASDASVLRAWQANDVAFRTVSGEVTSEQLRFERSREPAALLTALTRTRALVVRTFRAVRAQRASTRVGAQARTAALESLVHFGQSVSAHRGSTLALARGNRRVGLHLERRREGLLDRADAAAARAIRLFRSLGLRPG